MTRYVGESLQFLIHFSQLDVDISQFPGTLRYLFLQLLGKSLFGMNVGKCAYPFYYFIVLIENRLSNHRVPSVFARFASYPYVTAVNIARCQTVAPCFTV